MLPVTADPGSPGPVSYREQDAWTEFRSDPETFFGRRALLSVDLPPGLDPAAVRALVATLCARHDIFRTRYEGTVDRPRRHVLRSFPHTVTDGAQAPAPRRDGGSLRPDDLVRIRVSWRPDGTAILSFDLNAMVTDPWSCARLRAEALLLATGGAAQLPPLRTGYAAYAEEERTRPLRTEVAGYWREQLAGVDAVPGPEPDGPDPSGDPAGERIVVLPDNLTEALRRLCQRLRVSPFVAVTALVTMTSAALRDTRDLTVATMSSTRTGRYAAVQGNFSNLTVLRTVLPAVSTFTETVAATRTTVLRALTRPVPYLQLAELDGIRLPRPSLRVHYLPAGTHHYDATLDAKPSGAAWHEDADAADWPLDIGFAEDGRSRVAVWASYDTRLFTHQAVRRLVDGCLLLLESLAAESDLTCARLGALLAA